MICRNCGEASHHISTKISDAGMPMDTCTNCGDVGNSGLPDVYWPGYTHKNDNICDMMGKPIELTSRRHKAQVMKEKGLRESGDPYHGTRIGSHHHA